MEEKKQPTGVGHRFQEDHPRYGGRKKKTAAQARELAEQLGVDPLEYMLKLLTVDVIDEVEIDAKGKPRKVKVAIGHDLKIDICKTLANFFYPRLTATQVTGANEGPLELATFDLTPLIADPKAAEVLLQAAMLMAEHGVASIEAEHGPKPKLLEADYPD